MTVNNGLNLDESLQLKVCLNKNDLIWFLQLYNFETDYLFYTSRTWESENKLSVSIPDPTRVRNPIGKRHEDSLTWEILVRFSETKKVYLSSDRMLKKGFVKDSLDVEGYTRIWVYLRIWMRRAGQETPCDRAIRLMHQRKDHSWAGEVLQ